MIGLIGRKIGMTQVFGDGGEAFPVTVIEAGPCTVTEVRTAERHGYAAVQLGFGTNKETRFSKPVLGQFQKRNLPPARHLREFRVADAQNLEVGQSLTVALFEKGQSVDVQGVTKGRGFTGVVKRHGFVAGHASHGPTAGKQPGSIGASAYPSRVTKGKRLPGRMGGVNLTVKNLKVVAVDAEQNLLLVLGAVPGPPNGLVLIEKREG
ncbi:MAG TPA: 50S ribosomal protein L3 [Candidatus Eisenbacteria bacterium]|jgi:large subunit ribosomal protein L3